MVMISTRSLRICHVWDCYMCAWPFRWTVTRTVTSLRPLQLELLNRYNLNSWILRRGRPFFALEFLIYWGPDPTSKPRLHLCYQHDLLSLHKLNMDLLSRISRNFPNLEGTTVFTAPIHIHTVSKTLAGIDSSSFPTNGPGGVNIGGC